MEAIWINCINMIVMQQFTCIFIVCLFQYIAPSDLPLAYEGVMQPPTHREAMINAYVYVHQTLFQANERVVKRGGRVMVVTPRHYLDFINHFVSEFTKGWKFIHKVSKLIKCVRRSLLFEKCFAFSLQNVFCTFVDL